MIELTFLAVGLTIYFCLGFRNTQKSRFYYAFTFLGSLMVAGFFWFFSRSLSSLEPPFEFFTQWILPSIFFLTLIIGNVLRDISSKRASQEFDEGSGNTEK